MTQFSEAADDGLTFASTEWVDALIAKPTPPPEATTEVINLTFTDAPDGPVTVTLVVGTEPDHPNSIIAGPVDDAGWSIEIPAPAAEALLLDRNPRLAAAAFYRGEIKVTGDIFRLASFRLGR